MLSFPYNINFFYSITLSNYRYAVFLFCWLCKQFQILRSHHTTSYQLYDCFQLLTYSTINCNWTLQKKNHDMSKKLKPLSFNSVHTNKQLMHKFKDIKRSMIISNAQSFQILNLFIINTVFSAFFLYFQRFRTYFMNESNPSFWIQHKPACQQIEIKRRRLIQYNHSVISIHSHIQEKKIDLISFNSVFTCNDIINWTKMFLYEQNHTVW